MPAAVIAKPRMIRRAAAASLAGTSFEYYDFVIYGTAAALVFSQTFFPSTSSAAGTLAALATYAVGFFGRPLGGIIFGRLGDRVERKRISSSLPR